MTDIAFTKMQSCGNDFVVINAASRPLPAGLNFAAIADRKSGARCDRDLGLSKPEHRPGCDQILIMQNAPEGSGADFEYRIVNADGSEVGQCGNGACCVHRFLRDEGLTAKSKLTLQTKTARIVTESKEGGKVRAYLSAPEFDARNVPVNLPQAESYSAESVIPELTKPFAALSLGNPHAVFFYIPKEWDKLLKEAGEKLNTARDLFPEGVNVGFCREVQGDLALHVRVYERGAGITKSCGSGAVAAAVAAIRAGMVECPVDVNMPGGVLTCGWDGTPDSYAWLETIPQVDGNGTFIF